MEQIDTTLIALSVDGVEKLLHEDVVHAPIMVYL